MPTITTSDGTEILFKHWGSGQPIVFSHGWPLSSDDWDTQMLFFLRHGCGTPSTSGTPPEAARWHATSAATATPGWRRWP